MGRAKAARPTRRQKVARYEEVPPVVYQSDIPARPKTIEKFEPKNSRQREALGHLVSGKAVVFLTGSAGTGKSMLAAHRAATLLSGKRVDKIFLVRPAVPIGKTIGLLPGEIKDKLVPYFAQTIAHLRKFLGPHLDYCLEKDIVEMKPVEYLRGMSFEHCVVVAEEVQNFTQEEMEMMLTRIGENGSIIFTGDTKQHDLKGDSGLDLTINLIEKMLQTHPEYMHHDDMDELDASVAHVHFLPEDVVRSGLTRAFVKMYYHNT